MVHKDEHVILLLIVRGLRRRLLLHRVLSHRFESRNNDGGYYPFIVLYDLLSNRQLLTMGWASASLHLYPLKIPPTDLQEVGGAIGSSSHIAQLAEENGRPSHAAANVM